MIAQSDSKKEKTPVKTGTPKKEAPRILKAYETRKLQEKEAKKYDNEEKLRLKKAQEKIKLRTKKSSLVKKKNN